MYLYFKANTKMSDAIKIIYIFMYIFTYIKIINVLDFNRTKE